MGKMLLILNLAMAGLFSLINLNMTQSNRRMMVNSIADYSRAQAKNLAASGIEIAIMQIKQDTTWSGLSNLQIGGGTLNVTVDTTTNLYPTTPYVALGSPGRRAVSIGTVNNQSETIQAVLQIQYCGGGGAPFGVRAAITANNPVETLGTLQVDGREHDINGNLIANSGTLAISTTDFVSHDGNSEYYGTYTGADEGPIDKFGDNSHVIEENAVWDNGYPLTPDLFMGGADAGYTEGTLKSMAMSGADGGQYVTNPSNLSYPLSGVTYVEIPHNSKPNKRTWNSINFGNSSGILVVHNSSTSAIMKNLNGGTFTGLIIADDLIHIHCTIIGAVGVLTPDPSGGNCIGNGNGSVLYSTTALGSAGQQGGGGGGSCYSVTLASWFE